MKRWKQLLSGALTAVMLLGSTTAMYADDTQPPVEKTATMQVQLYQNGASSAAKTASSRSAADTAAIEKAIYDGAVNCEAEIDLSQFAIPIDEVKQYYQHVINNSPELFYTSTAFSYSYDSKTNTITIFRPAYTVTGTELEEQRATYNEKMNEILALVDENWSDLEKIVFLHDYLAQNYFYWLDPNPVTDNKGVIIRDDTNYDAYSFLTEGNGVCQAYTLTYLGLLKEVGINSSVASSTDMNHIWNLVQLDGEWYHVDVTWDDPVPDSYGSASHNHLLLSDTAISTMPKPHYGWTADYECTDTTYDSDYFWTQFTTPFKQLNGTWYTTGYSANDTACFLYSIDFAQKTVTSVYNMGLWHVSRESSSSYWTSSYSGLSTYNDKLYFNTESSIMSYDPSTDTVETVFTPTTDKSIYGMLIQGSTLYYNLKTSDTEDDIQIYDGLPELSPPEPSSRLQPGDVDGDEQITITDAFIVLKSVVGAYTMSEAQKTAADLNGNTEITLDDVRIILRIALHIEALDV